MITGASKHRVQRQRVSRGRGATDAEEDEDLPRRHLEGADAAGRCEDESARLAPAWIR